MCYIAICIAQLTIRPLEGSLFFVWPYPLLLSVQLLCDPGSTSSIVLADLAGLAGVIVWGVACERMWTEGDAVTAGRVISYVIVPPAVLTLLAAVAARLFGWPTGE